MSLKAKIEAVIYASEEPVTLAQLAGLLGHEAQAELDHLDSVQRALALEDAADGDEDEDALNDEILSDAPEEESELQHAEALKRHLQDAAAEEAAHTRAVRHNIAAATAAMSSADSAEALEDDSATASVAEQASSEQASDLPVAGASEDGAKKAAREARERERRLREYFRTILAELIADYATPDRGLEIREVAGGFRLATKPEYHDAVRGFIKSLKPALKLSLPALETLAVIAYKQPVTAPEIGEIRGVDSSGVIGGLLTRKLITTAGRKQVLGRPILYKTTQEFLLRFGLKDVQELPSLEEFEKMAAEVAEFEDAQPSSQEAAAAEAALAAAESAEFAELPESVASHDPAPETDTYLAAVEEDQVKP